MLKLSRPEVAGRNYQSNMMRMTKSKSFKIGRDTKTGELVPVEKAKHGSPERYVVEHMPKRGRGTAK